MTTELGLVASMLTLALLASVRGSYLITGHVVGGQTVHHRGRFGFHDLFAFSFRWL